jgi:hypothetical protein
MSNRTSVDVIYFSLLFLPWLSWHSEPQIRWRPLCCGDLGRRFEGRVVKGKGGKGRLNFFILLLFIKRRGVFVGKKLRLLHDNVCSFFKAVFFEVECFFIFIALFLKGPSRLLNVCLIE